MPSNIHDRLRGVIQGAAAPPRPASPPPATAAHDVAPAAAILGGEWRASGPHRSFVVERRYEPDTPYGTERIGDIGARLSAGAPSARLFGAAAAAPPFVFFDLETTGLSGGAGTYAFLVGCGRFDADGAFVIEQHLMVDPRHERAMLNVVSERLADAGALVTYNGKSFDAPVVETRYLFHREESPCAGLSHIDVLHPARRFWGRASEEGCSLTTLEARLLRMKRVGDVPGIEIPARYFHFLRTGDARPLAAVLEHNRLDLLTLAVLTARLFWMSHAGAESIEDAHEAAALGQTYQRAGLLWRAEDAFARAVELCGSNRRLTPVKVEAMRALAIMARRSRCHERSVDWWRQLLAIPECPAPVVQEANAALAVHHEHRVRDLEAARAFALEGLRAGVAARSDAARHRLARIERKLLSERRPLFPSSPFRPSSGSLPSASRTSS